MATPRYDYSNRPNVHEGPDALWTPEERAAWSADYERRNYIPEGYQGRSKVSHAVGNFEQKLWEFAYGWGFNVPDYVLWLKEVAFEVGGGCYELPEPKGIRDAETFRTWKDAMVNGFVADLKDEERWDDNPIESDEAKASLWVCGLSVYRIWQIYDACTEAAHEAVAENILLMALDDRGSSSHIQRASRRAMEKACKALDKEFEATQEAPVSSVG